MRKLFVAVVCGLLFSGARLWGYLYSYPYSYTADNDEVTIIGCDEDYEGELIIPAVIGGYPVVGIGEGAFAECTSLTSVMIPSSVTFIGDWAFGYCPSLTNIEVAIANEYYSSVGGVLFDQMKELIIKYPMGKSGSYIIPSSVTSIGKGAFAECTSLTSVMIPSSVTFIGDWAFGYCPSLTNIEVAIANEYYSSVDGVLLDRMKELIIQYPMGKSGSYIIPSSVTSIGDWTFEDCWGLTSVTISSNVTSIGTGAFSYCTSLTNVAISANMTSIGDWAFADCTSLTDVTIPSTVTFMGYGAFEYCISLTNVTISAGVTSIGERAFRYCTSLTSITIPSSVTSIDAEAFASCTSLTSITIPSSITSIAEGTFYGCTSLTSVMIPSSVTSIGVNAFRYCIILPSITIPASVTFIGDYAFAYCEDIGTLSFLGAPPTIDGSIFEGGSASVTIYIEEAHVASWQAIVWSGTIVEGTGLLQSRYVIVRPVFRASGTEFDPQNRSANFAFGATPGYIYQVQGRVSLTEGEWEDIGEPQTASGKLIAFSPSLPEGEGYAQSGFFRVVVLGKD